jgi:hypothetical protein
LLEGTNHFVRMSFLDIMIEIVKPARLAQSAERTTLNRVVVGSIPTSGARCDGFRNLLLLSLHLGILFSFARSKYLGATANLGCVVDAWSN